MKKLSILAITAAVLLSANSVWAGFPSLKVSNNSTINNAVNKGVKKGTYKALADHINKKIAKHGCQFKDATTTTATTCNLDKVVKELSNWRSGLESTIANDVNVRVQASAKNSSLGYKRAKYVRDQIRSKIGYWDYYVSSNTHNEKGLKIWVEIQ